MSQAAELLDEDEDELGEEPDDEPDEEDDAVEEEEEDSFEDDEESEPPDGELPLSPFPFFAEAGFAEPPFEELRLSVR